MSESAETTAQSEPAADGKDRFGATSSLPSGGESEHSGGHAYHPEPVSPAYAVKKRLPFDAQYEQRRLVVLVCLLLFTLWAYWPAITGLVRTWTVFVDYSHAFFVLPLTLFFLWGRRDTYPGTGKRFAWLGLAPILLSMTMRWHATNYDEESIENWSILFWVLGMVWFLYGTRTFRWALPSLLFLCFLFPLPYRFEVEFRQFLQEYASLFGTMLLQLVGEPAVQIQNTIQVGDTVVSVAAACSGLRFLISFFALAAASVLMMRRPWWQNLFVFVAVIPIAIFSNAARIALTTLFMVHAPETMQRFATETKSAGAMADMIAGIVMIVVAWMLFLGILWYLGKVFRQVSVYDTVPGN